MKRYNNNKIPPGTESTITETATATQAITKTIIYFFILLLILPPNRVEPLLFFPHALSMDFYPVNISGQDTLTYTNPTSDFRNIQFRNRFKNSRNLCPRPIPANVYPLQTIYN